MGYYSPIKATLNGVTESGWAGEINFKWVTTVPDGFASQFYAYCVDFSNALRDPETVTVQSSTGFTNGVTYGGQKAAWLFDHFADGIRSGNPVLDNLNVNAAALQVAIWEAMYDTTADLTSGLAGNHFKLETTGAIATKAMDYLNALYAATTEWQVGDPAYVAYILNVPVDQRVGSQLGQDQITSVPEPATMWLMVLGALVFGQMTLKRFRPIES